MPRPSVVLDTNVIVSAHLKKEGLERFVLDLAMAQKLKLFLSYEILEEYAGVLARPAFKLNAAKTAVSLRMIERISFMVRPTIRIGAAKDPHDNKFLACAAAAHTDYLVTAIKKHFPQRWQQTRIVNARELLQAITADLQR